MATSPVKTKPLVETIRKSEVFRKELTPWFPVREVKTIMRAYKISKYGHRDQTRHNGDRYFDHPKAVSLIIFKELKINDSESIVIALLHDVIEDSYLLDEETMEMIFGRSATNGVRIVV
jgi:(p)ppGpp synthase/HD superfamily hydrolase